MALMPIERSIMNEIKMLTGNRKLTEKDLLEWSTSKSKVQQGLRANEEMIHCASMGVWAAIPKQIKKEGKNHGKK